MSPTTASNIGDWGYCPNCRRNVLDHPMLTCGWCHSASTKLAKGELALPVDATPAQIIRAVTDHIDGLMPLFKSLRALRGAAARRALAGDLVAIAAEARVRVRSIEKWADGPKEDACAKGHPRAEHSDKVNGRWACRECKRLRPPRKPRKPAPASKSAMRKRWKAHEQRLARRKELADAGQLPERLYPPMPPPGPPPVPRTRPAFASGGARAGGESR